MATKSKEQNMLMEKLNSEVSALKAKEDENKRLHELQVRIYSYKQDSSYFPPPLEIPKIDNTYQMHHLFITLK